MPDWVRVAAVADCPPGCALEVAVGGHVIALFNVGGEFHAIDGICAHQGGPLGKGTLDGSTVTCPWHGWQYDVCNGRHLLSPIAQRVFQVKIEGEDVLAAVQDES
jgi:nitrite reductase/ring-hydroxylating ferredoxin subunit